MEKVIITKKDTATVSADQNSSYQPKIYVGSAGICFLAEALAIDTQMKMKDLNSEMQARTSDTMMTAASSGATAQKNAIDSDADAMDQSASGMFASIATSSVQAVTSFGALAHESVNLGISNKMGNLSDEVQNHAHATPSSTGVGDLDPAAANSSKVEEYRNLIINAKKGGRGIGAEVYENITKRAAKNKTHVLDTEIKEGSGITLRHVLNSSDEADLNLMKAGMKAESETFEKHLDSARKSFEYKKSIFDQVAQVGSTGAQARFKQEEAKSNRDKADESAKQTMEQTLSQNLASIASRQADASNQAFQAAQSGWSTISQMVQVDTRA